MLRKPLVLLGFLACIASTFLVCFDRAEQTLSAQDAPNIVKNVEAERIKVINKVKPAVVAVYARGGGGGGSGVVIDKEGYALTNFHVVQPTGPTMVCGLPNGVLYDAVLVGLDKVGDVALIKLIPKKPGEPFPYVELGNSDDVKPGDWSLAMGNPFLLATDFTPSVSYGLISGVNRYQYPSGGFLEYTDCIQFDTTINPGNSGGPLFNMKGELIGINGRGSFAQDKRFRINCGVGYAISINQIKNFLGHFRAGIDTDHATLGATVQTANEDGILAEMVVQQVLEEADAFRRDLREGDRLISFAGRPLTSVNQYKNILGIFPKDWRMPLVYARGNESPKETLVRLMGYQPSILLDKKNPSPRPQPLPKGGPAPKGPQGEGAKYYKAKKGFANYYFNEQEQKRVLTAFKNHGDFANKNGDWVMEGGFDREGRNGDLKIEVLETKGVDGKANKTTVNLRMLIDYTLDPLNTAAKDEERMNPPFSGGLLMAMYHYRRFVTMGPAGFENDEFSHGGMEPYYVHALDKPDPKSLKDIRIFTEVIRTEHAAVKGKWYFYRADYNPNLAGKHPYEDGQLVGFEIFPDPEKDPCEVYLHDYKEVDKCKVPHKMEIRHGDKRYAILTLKTFSMKSLEK